MSYEEYIAASKEAQVSTAATLLTILQPYTLITAPLSPIEWVRLLAAMFPIVKAGNSDSGVAARSFYDSERSKHLPDEEIPDVWLANLDPDDFEDAMKPHRKTFVQKEWPAYFDVQREKEETVARMVGDSMRIVDNGGRATMIEATYADPRAAWARVEGGNKSCPWCLMLISRGPVYSAEEAQKDSYSYHRFCDCRMTVVYDKSDYPGRDQWKAAEKLWKEADRKEGDTLKNLKEMIGNAST